MALVQRLLKCEQISPMRHTNKLLLLDEICRMSAFGGKTDMAIALRNACLWHDSDLEQPSGHGRSTPYSRPPALNIRYCAEIVSCPSLCRPTAVIPGQPPLTQKGHGPAFPVAVVKPVLAPIKALI